MPIESNDHDLLIALNTKVEILLQQHSESVRANNAIIAGFGERITALETKDSRDSEKVRSIDANVQRSLNNAEKISSLEAKISDLTEEVRMLRGKSNMWDIGNSIAVAITAAIGYFR